MTLRADLETNAFAAEQVAKEAKTLRNAWRSSYERWLLAERVALVTAVGLAVVGQRALAGGAVAVAAVCMAPMIRALRNERRCNEECARAEGRAAAFRWALGLRWVESVAPGARGVSVWTFKGGGRAS